MKPLQVVFLDRDTIEKSVSIGRPSFAHQWQEYGQTQTDQVVERLQDATIAITNKVPITAAHLRALPKLKFITVAATGINAIDIEACRTADVLVSNVQNYAATTVAEHTFAVILSLSRNLTEYREQLSAGAWQQARQFCFFNRPIHNLSGQCLGVIGTGAIATEVGRIGAAFGMKVKYHSLSARPRAEDKKLVSLDEIFESSDVLSLHCPLTELSNLLVNRRRFEQMKKQALLVNTARGEIVDIEDLEYALNNELIGGAAIDVAPTEPPSPDSPLMRLLERPNFLLTPHIAWASIEAMQMLADQLIENLEAFAADQPIRVVS